jgi:hypothetical protein
MPTLHRLEDPTNRLRAGILFTWDDGTSKQASFAVASDTDVQGTSKAIAVQMLQTLMDSGRADLANATNWVSVVAGCAKHVRDAVSRLEIH